MTSEQQIQQKADQRVKSMLGEALVNLQISQARLEVMIERVGELERELELLKSDNG